MERLRCYWEKSQSSKGQIMILAAFFAVVLAGMVGLSIDLGYTFAEKRSIQNAADAGALAGTHALTKWSPTNQYQTVEADVAAMVSANKMNSSTTQTYECSYVDDADQDQGACSEVVPPAATGVKVTVHETHNTFFVRVVPFAPKTVTTSATAVAHVQGLGISGGSDSPFIICGIDTKLAGGGTEPLLSDTDPVTINEDAYGDTFVIHSPGVSNCGWQDTGNGPFKGLADNDQNYNQPIPGWYDAATGAHSGPTRVAVNGIDGCAAGVVSSNINDCVLIIPIATKSSDGKLYVVATAAFQVTQCHANCHQGTLLKDYVMSPNGQGEWTGSNGWKRGDDGVVMVRLTR